MKIIPIKTKVNADALEILKDAIKRVESGEITSIALSWVTDSNGIGGDISSGSEGILLWSAINHSAISFYNDVVIGD